MPVPVSSPIADSFAKLGSLDLAAVLDLRRYLAWVPDPRGRCGRWYSMTSSLALCAAVVTAGSVTIEAICEWAADAPSEVLVALGVRRHPLGQRRSPSRWWLTSLLARIDGDVLDRAVCAWLAVPPPVMPSRPGCGRSRSMGRCCAVPRTPRVPVFTCSRWLTMPPRWPSLSAMSG